MHEIIKYLAEYLIALPVLMVLWILYAAHKKDRQIMLIYLVLGGILSLVFAKVASTLYFDPRPFMYDHITPYFSHAPGNGFPSDHTLLAAFLAYWTLLYRRSLGIVLLILAVAVGTARVAAGVHHLNDIVGSFVCALLGIGIAYGIVQLGQRFSSKRAA
jgi:undecaprenyl-diphosphatase